MFISPKVLTLLCAFILSVKSCGEYDGKDGGSVTRIGGVVGEFSNCNDRGKLGGWDGGRRGDRI